MKKPVKSGEMNRSKLHGDQLKIALSFSLLSVVALATFANRNLMSEVETTSLSSTMAASELPHGSRGIASVNTKTEVADHYVAENPQVAKELAQRSLSPNGQAGHQPSTLEKLAFGYLEGKYTVRLQDGKLASIELSDAGPDEAKVLDSRARFLESQRDLLPDFDRVVKQDTPVTANGDSVEVYELLPSRQNLNTNPVAKVKFHLDEGGHLISLQVVPLQIASNK